MACQLSRGPCTGWWMLHARLLNPPLLALLVSANARGSSLLCAEKMRSSTFPRTWDGIKTKTFRFLRRSSTREISIRIFVWSFSHLQLQSLSLQLEPQTPLDLKPNFPVGVGVGILWGFGFFKNMILLNIKITRLSKLVRKYKHFFKIVIKQNYLILFSAN